MMIKNHQGNTMNMFSDILVWRALNQSDRLIFQISNADDQVNILSCFMLVVVDFLSGMKVFP